jgi:hypothetical protein
MPEAGLVADTGDPVTNVLTNPFSLVTLAWGTAPCHDYTSWNYKATSPLRSSVPERRSGVSAERDRVPCQLPCPRRPRRHRFRPLGARQHAI